MHKFNHAEPTGSRTANFCPAEVITKSIVLRWRAHNHPFWAINFAIVIHQHKREAGRQAELKGRFPPLGTRAFRHPLTFIVDERSCKL